LSEPSARILGLYNDFTALLTDPALKRWRKEKHIDEKAWPTMRKKPFKLAGFKTPGTVFELTLDMKQWSEHGNKFAKIFETVLPTPDAKMIGRMNIVVQPDGDFTYVMTGDDTTEMARVMAEHRKSEPGVSFAKPAHSDKIVAAGFITLAYVARTLERSSKKPEVGKAIAATPNHGQTPIPFSTTVGAGSARVDVELPAAVFSDASAAIAASAPVFKDALKVE